MTETLLFSFARPGFEAAAPRLGLDTGSEVLRPGLPASPRGLLRNI